MMGEKEKTEIIPIEELRQWQKVMKSAKFVKDGSVTKIILPYVKRQIPPPEITEHYPSGC